MLMMLKSFSSRTPGSFMQLVSEAQCCTVAKFVSGGRECPQAETYRDEDGQVGVQCFAKGLAWGIQTLNDNLGSRMKLNYITVAMKSKLRQLGSL